MVDGKLLASPGHLAGGKVSQGTWRYVLLTANENHIDLYLDGEKVASVAGTKDPTTDAPDFFTDHDPALANLQVF